MAEFFREQTPDEKKDFKPLVNQSNLAQVKFNKKVEKEYQKYTSEKKPFCARCARKDYQELLKKQITNFERKVGYIEFDKLTVEEPELSQYGRADRFTLESEGKAMEPIPSLGQGTLNRQIIIGVHRTYRCKIFGCGVSIFLSNEDVENEKNKTLSSVSHDIPQKTKTKR